MREEYLDRVLEILGQQDAREQVEPVIRGIALLRLRQQDGQPSVLDALERIDAQLGAGVATPDHVLTVAHVGPCPATEPQPAYEETEPYL